MPNPSSDADQLRFAQIREHMLNSVAENIPEIYMTPSGAKTRADYRARLADSAAILAIIDCCAYEAQRMEERSRRDRR